MQRAPYHVGHSVAGKGTRVSWCIFLVCTRGNTSTKGNSKKLVFFCFWQDYLRSCFIIYSICRYNNSFKNVLTIFFCDKQQKNVLSFGLLSLATQKARRGLCGCCKLHPTDSAYQQRGLLPAREVTSGCVYCTLSIIYGHTIGRSTDKRSNLFAFGSSWTWDIE